MVGVDKVTGDRNKASRRESTDGSGTQERKKEGAVFIHTSKAGVTVTEGPGATVEKR